MNIHRICNSQKAIVIIILVAQLLLVNSLLAQSSQNKGMKRPNKLSEILPDDYVYRNGWVLAVGINEYPGLPPQKQLRYAVADAEALVQLLQEKFGFDKSHIFLLKNEKATKKNIIDKLYAFADRESVSEDDCMLFFFSGHGQTVAFPRGGEMGFLIPYDAKIDLSTKSNPAEYQRSCIAMRELHQTSKAIPARHRLFIIDACYSGLVLPSQRGLGTRIQGYLKKIAKTPTQEMITAGGKDEESEERPDLGHGVLTYKLLRGLEDELADQNNDGVITGMELYAYLGNAVMEMTDAKQTPQFGKEDEGEFLFIPLEKPKPSGISEYSLSINSNPEGSTVSINGQSKGITPLIIKLNEKPNQQIVIKISKTGFKTIEKKIELTSGQLDFNFQLQQSISLPVNNQLAETLNNVSGESKITGNDGTPMVLIPAGEFAMGSNNSNVDYGVNTEHKVYLDAFYIDVYEVTNERYRKFVEATGHPAPPSWKDNSLNDPKQPVVDVTWEDAVAYCQWAGKRLPTEAEWEKAARGGLIGKLYPWDDDISHEKANYISVSGRDIWNSPAPVGSFEPNGYGIYDMAGNVWEWCADWYSDGYYAQSSASNPKGPDSGESKVLRGGSWNVGIEYLYTSKRYARSPQAKYYRDHGFRCAMDVR